VVLPKGVAPGHGCLISNDHDLPPLADAYAELAGLLLASDTFDDLTQQIAALAARTVPVAATCAITVSVDGRIVTVASADPLGRLLDEGQYDIDEGPCLEAIRTGGAVTAPDVASETRWDGYPPTVLGHGIGSIYSEPLLVNGRALGALNLYAHAPGAFTPEATSLVRALAHLTAAGMAGALKNYDEVTLTSRLRRALGTRGVIDQAIGIIIAHQHIAPEAAFDVLRRISQTRNVRLHEVAREIVTRASGTLGDEGGTRTGED
jgi:GAF domain-containing protein